MGGLHTSIIIMPIENESIEAIDLIQALRPIAQALSVAADLDDTLLLIAEKTAEVMQADSCTIYLLDPDGETLRLRATTGLNMLSLGRGTLRIGEGMTGYAALQGHPIHSSEAHKNRYFKQVPGTDEQVFQSLLAAPLIIDETSIGAMNVQAVQSHQYKPDEVALLSLIADLAAGALYKARLYDVQKQQLDELQTLVQVSEAVTSPQYLDDILNVVTEMAAQALGAAVCSLFLINETGEYLVLKSARKLTSYQDRPPLHVSEGVIGRVAREGTAVYIEDVRVNELYLGRALAEKEGLVSMLAKPLSVRGKVIGVLACYTTQVVVFSDKQKTLLGTLANQTALAIENAHLITNAAVVKEMHHRIKNNLQTVAMLMQLQLGEAHKLDTREVLEVSIARIHSIATVHEVLSERGFRLVEVKDVLTRIVQGIMVRPSQDIKIQVRGEQISLPSKAATAVALVVNELVQNAVEHAFVDQEKGRVDITLSHTHHDFLVSVTDSGGGLPEEMVRNLGLELVETLVCGDLQGDLHFVRLPQGTSVDFRIPRSLASTP